MAFVLIGIIILMMPYYFKTFGPEKGEPGETASDEFRSADTTISESRVSRVPERTEPAVVEEPLSSEEVAGGIIWQDSTAAEPAQVTIETPLYRALIDCRGARIASFKLKQFSDRRGGVTEVIMLRPDGGNYPSAYLKFYRMGLSTSELIFEPSLGGLRLSEGQTGEIAFTARLKNGGYIRNTFRFDGSDYRIDLQSESSGIRLDSDYYFAWDGNVNVTEPDTVDDVRYGKAYALMGGELEKLDAPGRGERRLNPSGKVDWMALRSKYFIIGVIPSDNSAGIDFVAAKLSGAKTAFKEFQLALKMDNPEGRLNQKYTLYIGPIDSKRLRSLGVGMENTMSWGWTLIKPFSIAVLWAFKLIHQIVPNYGVVIIIFSILIKVILWPLTHKSYVSMRKMSKLQPLMKELREKYKGDPQKMQKATAQLYKEHKVNPLGGCLPTLLQMPLLIALFIVFRSTIELRGEPFFWWIKDLSLPDNIINLGVNIPLYGRYVAVLPLLMGITTYLQSKQSMTDPNQKMMIYFMPIFLVLMFNNFPSGLTLYYTLFNVLSVIQQNMAKTDEDEPKKIEKAKA